MLLDVQAVKAELGGLGESTVRKMIREGTLPVVRVGRRVMVSREALDDYIRRNQARCLGRNGTPADGDAA